GASLQLNSHNQTLGSLSGSGIVDLGAATLTAGSNGATTFFQGSINGSGGGSLVKVGAGTMTVQASVNVDGGVTVNGGTLVLAGNNSFSGAITAGNGGSVSVSSLSNLGVSSN